MSKNGRYVRIDLWYLAHGQMLTLASPSSQKRDKAIAWTFGLNVDDCQPGQET
jgi:hypothetical protein